MEDMQNVIKVTVESAYCIITFVKEGKLELEKVADTDVNKEGNKSSEDSDETHQNPSHHLHMQVGLGEREGGEGRGRGG